MAGVGEAATDRVIEAGWGNADSSRQISLSAVATRTWSWFSNPMSAAISRPR